MTPAQRRTSKRPLCNSAPGSAGRGKRLKAGLARLGAFAVMLGLLAAGVYSAASASSSRLFAGARRAAVAETEAKAAPNRRASARRRTSAAPASTVAGLLPAVLLQAQAAEAITTYESDCVTPSSTFDLGDTVCARVSGARLGAGSDLAPRRVNWVARTGSVVQSGDVTADPQTFSFTLPSSETTLVSDAGGGTITVDNRGVWKVYISDTSEHSFRTGATFTVVAPTPYVDLQLSQSATVQSSGVGAGSSSIFEIFLTNAGPNAAANVKVSDIIPADATFVSLSESTNVGFACTPPATAGDPAECTVASMPAGAAARLVLAYSVNEGTAAGTLLTNGVSVTSDTAELEPGDNSASFDAAVPTAGGAQTCTLTCREDMVVTANASQGGNPGAFVTFSAASQVGNCGTIGATPVSGSFFPVGATVVSVTSSEGGGSCSFTVTVVDTPAPTISCPADKVATADENGIATVNPGTPTTSPASGVGVAGVRSDGEELNAPYPTGLTIITWTATDSYGRTASCNQRVNVVDGACAGDTTPPEITAPANITVGTGADGTGCSVGLDDSELGQPNVTDDCGAAVTVTHSTPPGGAYPVGTTTVTWTATDAAGNSATATQTVTVVDDTKPVIVAPADAAYTCLSDVPAAHPSQATRGTVLDEEGQPLPPGPPFDNCGVPVVTVTETSAGAGSAANPRVITRTFTATDAAGNFSTAVQTITVTDPTPPTLTLNGSPSVTVECHTSFSDPGASAADNCGSATVTVAGSVNVNVPGTYTLAYTATDSAGNASAPQTRTVTVVDTQPPTISGCQADILVEFNPAVGGAVVTYPAPTGADSCAGALTAAQTTGLPSGATFPLGTTTNTFVVTDGAGLTASCSFKVTVALTSIVGLDGVSISGAGPVDSYDSNGSYSATKGSLANVLSNGTITLTGSARVAGNVRSTRAGVVMSGASKVTGNATAGTTVSRSGSATVDGTITNNQLAPVVALPAVPACAPYSSNSGISGSYSYNAGTGDLSLSGVNVATLANGTYCFRNLSVGSSAQLRVNGPVTIRLTGTLSTSGAAVINNTTLIPGNLRILSSHTGGNGVSFGNSASAHLVVYAPGTGVTISGAAPLFGTVAGKSITISNSGMLHYDTRLQSIWPEVWLSIFGP